MTTATSEKMIASNRANALKSTGPTSPEGKATSRRNALTHGLAGRGIVVPAEEENAIALRLAEWSAEYVTSTPEEDWALRDLVRESIRIDRCEVEDRLLRIRSAERAGQCWDDDRRVAAEELGSRLHTRPPLVARQLEMTPQGCSWLIERWEALALALELDMTWDDRYRLVAQDLLGVSKEFRDLPGKLDLPGADPDALRTHRLSVIAAELDRLRGRRDGVLAALDAEDRTSTKLGLEVGATPALNRVRRYASACARRFQVAFKLLQPAREIAARYRETLRSTPVSERIARPSVRPVRSAIDVTILDAIPPCATSISDIPPAPRPNRHQRRALNRREQLISV
jgi:hypothetical protein